MLFFLTQSRVFILKFSFYLMAYLAWSWFASTVFKCANISGFLCFHCSANLHSSLCLVLQCFCGFVVLLCCLMCFLCCVAALAAAAGLNVHNFLLCCAESVHQDFLMFYIWQLLFLFWLQKISQNHLRKPCLGFILLFVFLCCPHVFTLHS